MVYSSVHFAVSLLLFLLPVAPRRNTSCPLRCQCGREYPPVRFVVNCSYRQLQSIPSSLPIQTDTLLLNGNNIQELRGNSTFLPNLKSMDLSSNKIKVIGKDSVLNSIMSLAYLNMDHNQISRIPQDAFENVQKLAHLILSYNKLAFIEDRAFVGLTHLKHLQLQNNLIGSVYEEWFQGLDELQILNLTHNRIYHLKANVLRMLPKLEYLDLGYNFIATIDPGAFQHLPSLSFLNLENNKLVFIPTTVLKDLSSLKVLCLSSNPVPSIQTMDFSDLTVTEIRLNKMPLLTVVDEHAFHNLINLTTLHIHHNVHLKYLHPYAFDKLPNLKKVYLHSNELSVISRSIFLNLFHKLEASLHNNPLLCDCNIRWLRKELANEDKSFIKILNSSEMKCKSPASLEGSLVQDLQVNSLNKTCSATAIRFQNSSLRKKLGERLTLECRGVGIPEPSLHWILPDGKILNSSSNMVRIKLPAPGKLVLFGLKATDSGKYCCFVENSVGNDSIWLNLEVTGIDIHLFPSGVSSNFVTLVWNGTERNEFKAYNLMYRLSETLTPFQNISVSAFRRYYTINSLEPNKWYEFCIAFQDQQGSFVRISCTKVKTRDANFMSQGIQRPSTVAIILLFCIVGFMMMLLCGLTVALRRYRQRLYENPNKTGSDIAHIQLRNLYSPLVANMAS